MGRTTKTIQTPKRESRRNRERDQFIAFGLDINTGVEKLRPEDLLQREMPGSVNDAFVRARAWHRDNWFVGRVCQVKRSFFDYQRKLVAQNPKDAKRLKKQLEDKAWRMEVERFIKSVWEEWMILDTVVTFWRRLARTYPFLLKPEHCEYTDAFGIEKLRVTLDIKKQELEDEGKNGNTYLDPSAVRRYAGRKKLLLSEDEDEYFKVLTRGRKGDGLGWPRLREVFRTLSQNESMEIGESMLAFAGRLVLRQHLIGFEAKGQNAMRQADYLYDQDRAEQIRKFFDGRAGFTEGVSQFDHKVQYVWVPPELYDTRKWATVIDRLLWWGGAAGFMFMAKGVNPFLLPLFEAEAIEEREIVGLYLEYVLEEAFPEMPPVRLEWGDRCFRDPRLAWTMVQALMQQGPLSLSSALRAAGFNPEEEREFKKEEKAHKELLMPLWDPSHGKRPGDTSANREGEKAGRPAEKSQ
jgi:hypothetical protein